MKQFSVILLMLCAFTTYAQVTGTITGNIYDKSTKAPIEYSSVALFSLPDSSLITGLITNTKGEYKLTDIQTGTYYISVSFLGYKDKNSKPFTISESNKNISIEPLYISPDSHMLGEVQVTAQQHQVDYKIDKKVITVNESLTSASMSAIEVIESVPSIKVDVDGNVSMRGKSGFTVLIDGKPSVLDPSDVLRQIPATSIKSIEIITNPSAKYNPEGTGGIINIITKNNKTLGWQGLVNVKAGSFNMYGGDILLSYRQKKVNTFFGADLSNSNRPRNEYIERRTTENNITSTLITNGNDDGTRLGKSARAGFEWDIDTVNRFSLEGKIGEYKMNNSSDKLFTSYSSSVLDTVYETSSNTSGRGGNYIKLTSNYSHDFKTPKHKIVAEAYYNYRQWKEFSETRLTNTETSTSTGLYSTEDGPSSKFELKADYTKPWKFGMIEAGIQLRNGTSQDDITLKVLDSATNSFLLIDSMTNTLIYKRNIYAGYGILSGNWKRLEYKLGLRIENTQRHVDSYSTVDANEINVWDFFPSVYASYKKTSKNQFMINFSRRIDRPRSYYLEPFITWTDMLHARKGNSQIKPEYINVMEAGYIRKNKKTSISLETYYHIRHNKIERIEQLYLGGTSLTTFENVGTDYSFGVEGMYNTPILPFWELSCSGNIYNYKIVDENESSSINWGSSLHNTFKLKKNIKIQIDGMYNSASVTSQGSKDGYYSVNGAIRTDFFKNTLSASLQVRDIFSQGEHVSIVETENLYSYKRVETLSPNISLTLSYKINNYKAKRKGEGIESDDF